MANITERNGSYRITVSAGYDIFGKKIRETTTFTPDPTLTPKKRQKAVEDFARDFEQKVLGGISMDGRKIVLVDFVARWKEEWAMVKLQPRTVESYGLILDQQILPKIGHLKLTELKPATLNRLFIDMTKDGARRDGKPGGYSRMTIKKAQDCLSSVLRVAVDWELIEKNPMDKVRTVGESAADKIEFWTTQQAVTFLDYIEQPFAVTAKGGKRTADTGKEYMVRDYVRTTMEVPEQLRILFNLAIFAGLRKGELLALEWDDIDYDNDTVTVSKACTLAGGQQLTKEPKTKNSKRTISIPHFLTQRIKALRHERLKYRISIGDYWQGAEWIFVQDNGRQMNYSTPYLSFHKIIDRYNADKAPKDQLPAIPFHGLRHTSATLLIANKTDIRTVSARLGHAQASTTLNIYAHALEEVDRKAVSTLENALRKQA